MVYAQHYDTISEHCKNREELLTFLRIPVSLSVSQSMIIWPSFLLSKSWNTFRKEASVMVSTLTEVTSQFLSAAVSRTFCSTDKPKRRKVMENNNTGQFLGSRSNEEAISANTRVSQMILKSMKKWFSGWWSTEAVFLLVSKSHK